MYTDIKSEIKNKIDSIKEQLMKDIIKTLTSKGFIKGKGYSFIKDNKVKLVFDLRYVRVNRVMINFFKLTSPSLGDRIDKTTLRWYIEEKFGIFHASCWVFTKDTFEDFYNKIPKDFLKPVYIPNRKERIKNIEKNKDKDIKYIYDF